ncbi:MAG: FtsH protease activity modulator HflK [Rhizomicrobium sp.]|jgi:membrane protease subunit HflK
MPWNNQGSGGNGQGSGGPWGRGTPQNGGGSNGGPPDVEDFLRRGRDRLARMMPGNEFNIGAITIVALGIVVIWMFSGIYFVTPSEQGVVLRFGAYVAQTGPGMHYHLPWPIETVERPEVTSNRQIAIGYRLGNETDDTSSPEDQQEERLMLTGDENIVDVNFTVNWSIKDAPSYLFNVDNPEQTIKAVAESAMREVVGESQIESILTQDKARIGSEVRDLVQKTLDSYNAGIAISQVNGINVNRVDVPEEVQGAYRDVQAARANQETARNSAEGYANQHIPEARGQAAKVVQDAEAYRQRVIAEAEGEAKRFLSVYEEYKKAPEVTRRRMYLETMSQILGDTNKIVIDDGIGKGVVPYLPLPALNARKGSAAGVAEPSGTPASSPGSGASQ